MHPITVTSPLLPELEKLREMMQDIWDKKWVTNLGEYHEQLEARLAQYLGVKYLSLYTNGTIPLISALQALDIREGEVITTPFSFVATSHAIWWNGLTPVFADVRESDGNLDPERIEAAITPRTRAILPVHVYGNPCDTEAIGAIALKHGLKVIYDAAHAFGVRVNGKSLLEEGDISTLSFHATKVFNTLEGGAIVCNSAEMKRKLDYLRNFGFEDEVTVVGPGINGKMDEVRAAVGLLNLQQVDRAIAARKSVAERYRKALRGIPGLRVLEDLPGVQHNYAYFPVFIDEKTYGRSRDEVYAAMKAQGVFGRRYFYPLISSFGPYAALPSASAENLPVAHKIAEQVLCLPMHHALSEEDVQRVLDCLTK
ncbi:MAG: DegT/DnrJ/EryC1/StrS family aminotransferase [Bacteroidales bacterium]|nr:DegT/DnrJ/EryC1/StrS family aminotransferase [Bacteroidales bacterium]